MTKHCSVCERMLHDGDSIIFVGKSIYHTILSQTTYAMERPTECYKMCHEYCRSGEEAEL